MKKIAILIFGFFILNSLFAQHETIDFLAKFQPYNYSKILLIDSTRGETVGYIGQNYQRFYIHFISIIQNPENNLEYFIYGKSRVKNNICSFQGILIITDCKVYKKRDFPPLQQGYVKGSYTFFEDKSQNNSGFFNGNFQSDFYIDSTGKIQYDGLMSGADGYINNQFEGIWTSYTTTTIKKCNWGDGRIPNSDGFDCGAGEFLPYEKYKSSGWENYFIAWVSEIETPQVLEAQTKEREKWWLDK